MSRDSGAMFAATHAAAHYASICTKPRLYCVWFVHNLKFVLQWGVNPSHAPFVVIGFFYETYNKKAEFHPIICAVFTIKISAFDNFPCNVVLRNLFDSLTWQDLTVNVSSAIFDLTNTKPLKHAIFHIIFHR